MARNTPEAGGADREGSETGSAGAHSEAAAAPVGGLPQRPDMRFGDGARAHDARRVDGAVDDRGGDAAFVAVAVISHDHADASGEAQRGQRRAA